MKNTQPRGGQLQDGNICYLGKNQAALRCDIQSPDEAATVRSPSPKSQTCTFADSLPVRVMAGIAVGFRISQEVTT